MATLSSKSMEDLERWQKNEGKAEPSRGAGAPEGNLNRMTHGIFASKCLDEEERTLFQEVIDRLYTDFVFNGSSDFIQIEFIAINTVKYMRAIAEGATDAAQRLDGMIRASMKDIKATKISREGDKPVVSQTTPAEWAADLLQNSDGEPVADKAKKTSATKKQRKSE